MSGVIKFFKSLVSSEPAATAVLTKTPDVLKPTAPSEPSSASPSHSTPSNVQTVKPHVPLISFRKGGPATGHKTTSGASPGVVSGHGIVSRGTIEDYQLPSRYQRTPLDEKEIDYINRGGPE